MNPFQPDILKKIEDYLSVSSFVPNPCPVRFQAHYIGPQDPQTIQQWLKAGRAFDFCFQTGDDRPFGHISIALHDNLSQTAAHAPGTKSLIITRINAAHSRSDFHGKKLGIGQEVLRRVLCFAKSNKIAFIDPVAHIPEMCSYWSALGFRSTRPLHLAWKRTSLSKKFAEAWEMRLCQDPDSLRRLARTKVGRDVLKGSSSLFRLDLTDQAQRNYVFCRLGLSTRAP